MKQVVITGIGLVSPLGSELEVFWDNLINAKSGITRLDALEGLPVAIGGPAQGFDPAKYLSGKELRHMDRFTQMALTAGLDAVKHAGITKETYPSDRIGVMVGSGAGGMASLENQINTFTEKGHRRVSPLTVPMFIVNMAAGVLAIHLGAKGPGMDVTSACATGGHTLAMAARLIQAGDADCIVAGSMEACLTPFSVSAFAAMRALSTRNDEPQKASRPFDRDRDGFIMSEGGAILVLESAEHAKARKAPILASLKGLGMSQDAYHMVAPDPEGTAVISAMRRAIENAGLQPGDIDYINAHGTSTQLNDKAETLAIKNVFGPAAADLLVSSTKSMTGHLIGGAASLESAVCVLAMSKGVLPPTINLDNVDPECELNHIANQALRKDVKYCMNNAFAFGGQNISLIFEKGGAA